MFYNFPIMSYLGGVANVQFCVILASTGTIAAVRIQHPMAGLQIATISVVISSAGKSRSLKDPPAE